MNEVKYLILSDAQDFATDYVAIELEERSVDYLRLDRDLLHEYKVAWNIESGALFINKAGTKYQITSESLVSVYYRAPTYLRETFVRRKTVEDQVKQSQWMSFYRNLSFFDKALWMNKPSSTFKAENKILQLKVAKEVGFKIPKTIVSNSSDYIESLGKNLIVKSLDTAIFDFGEQEAFVYTMPLTSEELKQEELSLAPVIIQNNLSPKIDYRVTVVGREIFPVQILKSGKGVDGDWRLEKENVEYIPTELPEKICGMCRALLSILDLNFGAIDLALYDNEYFFIEVNPTGEWAWLVDAAGMKIYKSIANFLIAGASK